MQGNNYGLLVKTIKIPKITVSASHHLASRMFLCMPHEMSRQKNDTKERAGLSSGLYLLQRRFSTTHANRKTTFYISEQWFRQNFQLNRLYKCKETKESNFTASSHIKREKSLLTVEVCR